MKKRILSLIMVTALAVGLTACGSSTESSDSKRVAELEAQVAELQQQLEEAKQGQSAENTTDLANNSSGFDAETQELIEYTVENAEYQGVCGADAKWYYKDNVLVIRGTGEITDNPWHNASYDMLDINWVVIDEGITSLLCDDAFEVYQSSYNDKIVCNNCQSLSKVILPSTLISTGEGTFSWCTNLTNITIPSGITTIGDYAFWGCTSLTSVAIPNSVTSIGDGAFKFCDSLDSETIEKIESINPNAFINPNYEKEAVGEDTEE